MCLAVVALLAAAPAGRAADSPEPNLRDLRLSAQIIAFQDMPVSGAVRLGIVFNPGDATSVRDAKTADALLAGGLSVGAVDLHPVLIPQSALAQAGKVDMVFSMTGVDAALLRPMLVRQQVPCLTLDQAQLKGGACMVVIQSSPSVSIVFNQANAEAAGVHFATAFRMMVKEQ